MVLDTYGNLDILVSRAGIIRDNLLFRMTDNDWSSVINTHLGVPCTSRGLRWGRGQTALWQDRLPLLGLGRRQPRPDQLLVRQGQIPGDDADARVRAREVRINVNAAAPGFVETRITQATAHRMRVRGVRRRHAVCLVPAPPARRRSTPTTTPALGQPHAREARRHVHSKACGRLRPAQRVRVLFPRGLKFEYKWGREGVVPAKAFEPVLQVIVPRPSAGHGDIPAVRRSATLLRYGLLTQPFLPPRNRKSWRAEQDEQADMQYETVQNRTQQTDHRRTLDPKVHSSSPCAGTRPARASRARIGPRIYAFSCDQWTLPGRSCTITVDMGDVT